MEHRNIITSRLVCNKGQIPGLPPNPRKWGKGELARLWRSIEETPALLEARGCIVYPLGDMYIILGGNMRFTACKQNGMREIPCIVLPENTQLETLKEIVIKDNGEFGEWDSIMLNYDWSDIDLVDWGVPDLEVKDEEQESSGPGNSGEEDKGTAPEDDQEQEDDEWHEPSFEDKMLRDVLFPSDNPFEIPVLQKDRMARELELPVTPWGANSRLRKDVTTYHFYVDDYRFEKLWSDPMALILSGCKAIVEPNCSLHDQTPIAYGIHLIYKKRWLARYMQSIGVDVYADLNVAAKFVEYNKMGIPKGWNAFMTRGLTGWIESLKSDLKVAQEISGLETPNLIVYGGGKNIQEFCMEHSLLYVSDFISAKKI